MNNNWNRNRMRGPYRGGGRGFGRGRGSGDFWVSGGFRGSYPRFDRGGRGGQMYNRQYDGNINNQWRPKPKPEMPSKRLSEKDIFVTEYISDHQGFNGIIKSRFSDFQVAEINLSGVVAKLTDLSPPAPIKDDSDVEDDEDLLFKKYNLEILPMETWDRINKLAISTDSTCEKVEIEVTGMSKEERTKIHDAVKKAFGESIVGSTVNIEDKKFMTFERYRKGLRIDKRVKWMWPGEYVHFLLYKQNFDTMEAASRVAERLRLTIRPQMLGYSGTKDRRAKTTQWFSLRKVDPRKIAQCNDLKDLKVGNFSFADYPLKLGMLKGNVFRICLRNVTASEEVISSACSLLQTNGFINYYGLQRFGTRVEMPTYQIGKLLLQGKFREALAAVTSGGGEDGRSRRVAAALARAPNDLLAAVEKLPRNSRLLYMHSYQSLLWNDVATRRLTHFPRRPLLGDLVALDDFEQEEMDDQSEDEEENVEKPNTDKKDTDKKDVDKKKKFQEKKKKIPVKVLTQEDIDSNAYTIFDIVLPLPGQNVEYPSNLKDYYETLLAEDGLRLDMKHKYKSYSLSGGYRRVVVVPAVRWSCVRYSDPRADLLLSDLDLLEGKTDADVGQLEDGKYKALLLTLTLPTSCYATMALRELLRVDTSGDNQALQNNYHKSDEATSNDSEKDVKEKVDESGDGAEKRKIDVDGDDGDVDTKKAKQDV